MMRRIFASPPPPLSSFLLLLRPFSSASSSSPIPSKSSSSSSILSEEELTRINTVICRLCDSNHFQEAILLLSTSLLAAATSPISSIPLLVDRLSSHPSLSPSFSLLTTLRFQNTTATNVVPFFSRLLITSLLRKRRLKEAAKVFSWMLREDNGCLCRPDEEIYRVFIGGVCEKGGEAAEVVRAVREMVRDGLEVGEEVRGWVWMSLLREARINEAKELDAAFSKEGNGGGGGGEGCGVGKLLDRIIRDWEE